VRQNSNFLFRKKKKKGRCPEENGYLNPFQDSKKTLKE
jgi:hypothetical protein